MHPSPNPFGDNESSLQTDGERLYQQPLETGTALQVDVHDQDGPLFQGGNSSLIGRQIFSWDG
jgi:hypothetical protein